LYDIRPGNGAGQFLQPRSPHRAKRQTVLNCLAVAGSQMLCQGM